MRDSILTLTPVAGRYKNDTLTFFYTFEKQTSSYHFLVIDADRRNLIIKFIGYNNWFDASIHKTRYLKKAAD